MQMFPSQILLNVSKSAPKNNGRWNTSSKKGTAHHLQKWHAHFRARNRKPQKLTITGSPSTARCCRSNNKAALQNKPHQPSRSADASVCCECSACPSASAPGVAALDHVPPRQRPSRSPKRHLHHGQATKRLSRMQMFPSQILLNVSKSAPKNNGRWNTSSKKGTAHHLQKWHAHFRARNRKPQKLTITKQP